jgi:hypothetical protein
MWVLLKTKLTTTPSPPKLSIFWSVAWPDYDLSVNIKRMGKGSRSTAVSQYQRYVRDGDHLFGCQSIDSEYFLTPFGKSPNWIKARKIRYCDTDIRIFPHEFSKLSPDSMRMYIMGDTGDDIGGSSHILRAEGVASEHAVNKALNEAGRMIYDAAQVDGCTDEQAMMVALGVDITLPDAEFPPLGWYQIKQEYGLVFASPDELMEHRVTPATPDNYTSPSSSLSSVTSVKKQIATKGRHSIRMEIGGSVHHPPTKTQAYKLLDKYDRLYPDHVVRFSMYKLLGDANHTIDVEMELNMEL